MSGTKERGETTVSRILLRFEPWSLCVDTTGSPPIYEAECTTCNETSGAADEQAEPEVWCLRHAGRTGHSGFRGITTAFFRAIRLGQGDTTDD